MKSYFPPWDTICRRLGIADTELKEDKITIPTDFFRELLSMAMETVDIDTSLYARQQHDVAAALGDTDTSTLALHFRRNGYFEGRLFPVAGFDERYYVRKYIDVARAVVAKKLSNAFEHYQNVGIFEFRSPSSTSESDLVQWEYLLRERKSDAGH
jgi:hypothetical protein